VAPRHPHRAALTSTLGSGRSPGRLRRGTGADARVNADAPARLRTGYEESASKRREALGLDHAQTCRGGCGRVGRL